MPIREFICKHGHVTEKILAGKEDETTMNVVCEQQVELTDMCGPSCNLNEKHICAENARRIDISRASFRLDPGGVGGFYKPNQK